MKLIAIGDTHGQDDWKRLIEQETFDKIVFMGDYFDAWKIEAEQQLTNFLDILAYKKVNPDKVVLLFGNHDLHYLSALQEYYSGYQEGMRYEFEVAINLALDYDYAQMCYEYEGYLFSHAGFTKWWLNKNRIPENDIERAVNELFKRDKTPFCFNKRSRNPYGDCITQGPVWVRPNSLKSDLIDGYRQVVGHTVQNKIRLNDSIICIDTLQTSKEYLIIENGIESIGTIKEKEDEEIL